MHQKIGVLTLIYIISMVSGIYVSAFLRLGERNGLEIIIFTGFVAPLIYCWVCAVFRKPANNTGDSPLLYMIFDKGKQHGPYTALQLPSIWTSGTYTASALYWSEGMSDWKLLSDLCECPKVEIKMIYLAHRAPKNSMLFKKGVFLKEMLMASYQATPHYLRHQINKILFSFTHIRNFCELLAINLGVPRTLFYLLLPSLIAISSKFLDELMNFGGLFSVILMPISLIFCGIVFIGFMVMDFVIGGVKE